MGSRVAARKACSKKTRLILVVKADLKPNAAVRYWSERGWMDVAGIQPGSDLVHGVAEGSWLPFYPHDKGWIERHIALLPLAREAGAFVSGWGHQCQPQSALC